MKVKSDDRTLADVLTAHYLLIPRFQRPYEWTNGEVEDFWDDVNDSGSDYFIGSMVVFTSTHGLHGVVDGQQRVTTITLLMCAIRDALRVVEALDEAAGLQNLIERKSVLDNKAHFVLQSDEDRPYLRHVQSGQMATPPKAQQSEKQLKTAHDKLVERVSNLTAGLEKAEARDKLLGLRNKLLGLRLIYVEVDNEDDAAVIFQTLNSRGRDLETADLVKSHILSLLRATNPQHDLARQQWNGISERLHASSADLPMDRFLLHSWLSRREYLGRASLGKAVRKSIRQSDAQNFLDALDTDSRLYREIQEPEYRKSWQQEERPLQEAFKALQLFRVRQPLPWLLALWREYEARGLRQKHLLPAVQVVERFHFIATAITNQPSSGGVSKMYARAAERLTASDSVQEKVDIISDINQKLTDGNRVPSFEQFSAAFARIGSSRVYTQQARLAQYILQRLHISQSSQVPDFSTMTVEHIAPQGSKKPAGVSDAQVAQLGNLILVPRALNESLGDLPFAQKKPLLRAAADAGTYVPTDVLEGPTDWSAKEIEARTQELAKIAYQKVWVLPV